MAVAVVAAPAVDALVEDAAIPVHIAAHVPAQTALDGTAARAVLAEPPQSHPHPSHPSDPGLNSDCC